jgi:hypothetical protein
MCLGLVQEGERCHLMLGNILQFRESGLNMAISDL